MSSSLSFDLISPLAIQNGSMNCRHESEISYNESEMGYNELERGFDESVKTFDESLAIFHVILTRQLHIFTSRNRWIDKYGATSDSKRTGQSIDSDC